MMIFNAIVDKIKKKTNTINYWRDLGAEIGYNCEIYSTSSFGSEPYLIHLGNNVRVNHHVQLITHDGGVWVLRNISSEYKNIDLFGEIWIGNNVHIGTNAIVMPNVHIGDNCIIGCGAIVTKDIPDNSIAVGIPAKVIETIEQYEKKHKNNFDYIKHLTGTEKKNYLTNKFKKELPSRDYQINCK